VAAAGWVAQLVEQRTENSKGAFSPVFIVSNHKSSSAIKCLILFASIAFSSDRFAITKNHKASCFHRWGYKMGIQSFFCGVSDVFGVGRSDGISGFHRDGDVMPDIRRFWSGRARRTFRADAKAGDFAIVPLKTRFFRRKADVLGADGRTRCPRSG
jgi:hypothetical protein